MLLTPLRKRLDQRLKDEGYESRAHPFKGATDFILKYNSPVTFAAGNPLPVKVFKQRNRVLARDAGEILESGDVDRSIGLSSAVLANFFG